MKTTFLFRIALAAAVLTAAGALTSCTSPIERRIVKNPQLYERLSASDRSLVSQGEIREGMTKEAVFLAMGRPDQVGEGREKGGRLVRWTYLDSQPVATTSLSLGWGGSGYYGGRFGYGYGYGGLWDPYWAGFGPTMAYTTYSSSMVEFRNDRVVKYLRER